MRPMSVYTAVTPDELDAWLARYALGTLVDLTPIAAGIENTNYFVTTERGRYVLTLYERLPADELPFYLNLMAHLARAGVEVPAPAPDRTGALFSHAERPARGTGRAHRRRAGESPSPEHCAAVGDALARLHCASQSYRARLTNRRGPGMVAAGGARRAAVHRRRARTSCSTPKSSSRPASARASCRRARSTATSSATTCCSPTARVAGIIDFGFAATDFFAYDLAIAVNDWCVAATRDGALDGARTSAMVARLSRRAAADRRRARAMAGAAARGGAALLGVAALRPVPAAPGRAHARARSRAVRAHPARARRSARAAARRLTALDRHDGRRPPRDIPFTRHDGRRGIAWLRESYRDVRAAPAARGSACCSAITSRCCSSTCCRGSASCSRR